MVEVREAALLVRRTPETVRRWVWAGRLTAVRQGNRLLLPRADLLRLASGTDGAAERAPGSLAAWAAEVARTLAGGRPGVSAADLVLADRSAREGSDAGH